MLASLVRYIHYLLIILILISPFVSNQTLKQYMLIILVYSFFKYMFGYKKCTLTEIEYWLTGEKYENGFLYKLANPFIDIDIEKLNTYIMLFYVIYIIILSIQLDILR